MRSTITGAITTLAVSNKVLSKSQQNILAHVNPSPAPQKSSANLKSLCYNKSMNGHDDPVAPKNNLGGASTPTPAPTVGSISSAGPSPAPDALASAANASAPTTPTPNNSIPTSTAPSAAPTPSAASTPIISTPSAPAPRTPLVSSDVKLPGAKAKRSKMPLILAIIAAVVVLMVVIAAVSGGGRPNLTQVQQSFNRYAGYLTTDEAEKPNLDAERWYLFELSNTSLTNTETEEYIAKLEAAYGGFCEQLEKAGISNKSEVKNKADDYRKLLRIATWYSAYPQLSDQLLRTYLESGIDVARNYITELTSNEFADEALADLQLLLYDFLSTELELYEAYNATGCISDGVVDPVCFSDANEASGAYRELVSEYENTDAAFVEVTPFVQETLRTETKTLNQLLGGENE